MTRTRIALLSLLVAAAGCNSSPTAPPPVPVLSVSESTVSLERTATSQITAISTVSGSTTDVTASATWRSSNEQVARVVAGLITAVGPGTATITVETSGVSKAIPVTVRRRVFLRGELLVQDGRGEPGGIASLDAKIDTTPIGATDTSSPEATLVVDFGMRGSKVRVSPGEHVLALSITTRAGDAWSDYPLAISFDGPASVVDFDTNERVGTVTFENKSGTFPDDPDVTWSFTLNAFTS